MEDKKGAKDKHVQKGYGDIQDKLEEYLAENLSAADYTHYGRTHVAVKFKYKQLEVDLLLSPYWRTKEEYYLAMKTIPKPFYW